MGKGRPGYSGYTAGPLIRDRPITDPLLTFENCVLSEPTNAGFAAGHSATVMARSAGSRLLGPRLEILDTWARSRL